MRSILGGEETWSEMVMEEEANTSIFSLLILFNIVLLREEQDERLCLAVVFDDVSIVKCCDHEYWEEKEEDWQQRYSKNSCHFGAISPLVIL